MTPTLKEAREEAWKALGKSRWRRAMLGRDRCDRIVRLALDTSTDGEQLMAGVDSVSGESMRAIMRERIANQFSERCSGVFTTFILSWAISAIVQALVLRWWSIRT